MPTTSKPALVREKQLWTDASGATVRVVDADDTCALVEIVTMAAPDRGDRYPLSAVGRPFRVMYSDGGLRGYTLVAGDEGGD
jgi:hypothetical protein